MVSDRIVCCCVERDALRAENERLRADLEKARWDHNNTVLLAQHDNERLRAALVRIGKTYPANGARLIHNEQQIIDIVHAALDGQPAPSRWVERWDAPMPYQKWCPFSADTIVEVENAYGERRAGQAASFWWGYEHEMGRTSDGVIIRARPVQPAPGKVEPRADSRYNNAERIFGDD